MREPTFTDLIESLAAMPDPEVDRLLDGLTDVEIGALVRGFEIESAVLASAEAIVTVAATFPFPQEEEP